MAEYLKLPYNQEEINFQDLAISEAHEFADIVDQFNFVKLIKCEKTEDSKEIITLDIQVSLGQNPKNDIRYKERIAVLFEDREQYPWVFALREDFPDLLHLNLMEFEKPRCLCIYEERYQEAKHGWRLSQFLEDIKSWLERNAYNELHQENQPLEPLLLSDEGRIILPKDLKDDSPLYVYPISKEANGKVNFITSHEGLNIAREAQQDIHCQPLIIKGNPQEHGISKKHPRNIFDLSEFVEKAGIDLFQLLKEKLTEFKSASDHKLLIITELPKTATNNSRIKALDCFVFLTFDDIEKIGKGLNLWERWNDELAEIYNNKPNTEASKNLKIGVLRPSIDFTKDQAALFNGVVDKEQETKIAQIGTGALGSNLFWNLSRMGFGKWTVVDEDILLPHNLARHVLGKPNLGFPKSAAVSVHANNLLNSNEHSSYIWDDFLSPKDPEKIQNSFREAELIIDASTSIAVERELVSDKYGNGRRISIFLNPDGTDLVIFAEDQTRTKPLDLLEFQFYRALINNPQLSDHLIQETGEVRYSNACRDISSRLPYDNITLLSSVASNKIRKIENNKNAEIGLWRINNDDLSVQSFNISSPNYKSNTKNGWDVVIDNNLIELLTQARLQKLPNETGGILIGGYDMYRKKIYVMDSILSPKDSHEYPEAYIRGIEGVEEKLDHIDQVTHGNLKYLGEWHSHPPGASLNPSQNDKKLFSWLTKEMNKINLPPLMLIMGGKHEFNVYVEKT
jgi:integrative and conjugative element protein (TIGR02256 family)